MRRAALLVLLLAATTMSAAAPEKWWDAYARGVAAVNSRNYKVAAESLQKSIAEMPNEGLNVRTRKELITYVPYFWLGIARFNLGDVEGALRAWDTSERQGVVARTEYYPRMKDWVARAQTEKQRNAQSAATGPKKEADAAITRALQKQLEALSSGGDRSESYLSAQRRLQEARAQFQKAGTDVNAYVTAEQTAQQAATLFDRASEEGKKLRAARSAPAPVKKTAPAPVQASLPPPPVVVQQPPPQEPVVLTEAEATKRIAEQEEKRRKNGAVQTAAAPSGRAGSSASAPQVQAPPRQTRSGPEPVEVVAPAVAPGTALRAAYRAYASGDLASSEKLLNGIVAAPAAPAEAYLLRGCTRYTRAMLSREPQRMLDAASDDFRTALKRDRKLRLDRAAFSPKLVEFFEQVRKRR